MQDNQSVASRALALTKIEIQNRGGRRLVESRPHNRSMLEIDTPFGHRLHLRIKGKTGAHWITNLNEAKESPPQYSDTFWVLVDLVNEPADFYIMTEPWIQKDIHKAEPTKE